MKTTKDLARELGLLRKRTLSSTGVRSSVNGSQGQLFKYLIVIDFESTCWQDGKFRTQEIIEFPAVLLNTISGEIESEFHHYVQPQEQPVLSSFCTELTGIRQSQVDEGIPISLCLKKFTHWLDRLCSQKGVVCHGSATDNGRTVNATFVTWSDWDLGVCLQNECKRKQLMKPVQLNTWIDLRATYRKFYDRKPNGLNGALQDLGIEFQGREHSGVDDARNTAKLAFRMIKDGCVMKTTRTVKTHERSASCYPSIPQSVSIATRKTPPRKAKQTSSSTAVFQNCASKFKTPSKTCQSKGVSPKNTTPHSIKMKSPKIVKSAGPFTSSSSDVPVDSIMSADRKEVGESFNQPLKQTPKKQKSPSKIPLSMNSPHTMNQSSRVTPSSKNYTSSSLSAQNLENSDPLLCPKRYDSFKENSNPLMQNPKSSLKRKHLTPVKDVARTRPQSPARKKVCQISPKKLLTSQIYVDPNCDQSSQSTPTLKNISNSGLKIHDTNVSKKVEEHKKRNLDSGKQSRSSSNDGDCFKKPSPIVAQHNEQGFKIPLVPIATPKMSGNRGPSTSTPKIGIGAAKNYTPAARNSCITPSCTPDVSAVSPAGLRTSYQTPCNNSSSSRVTDSNGSDMKATPPLCKCGRRSQRRMVQSPGQNMGRFFFSCAVRKRVGAKEGCEFFKWESSNTSNMSTSYNTRSLCVSKQFTPVLRGLGPSGCNSAQKRNLGVRYVPGQKSFIR